MERHQIISEDIVAQKALSITLDYWIQNGHCLYMTVSQIHLEQQGAFGVLPVSGGIKSPDAWRGPISVQLLQRRNI